MISLGRGISEGKAVWKQRWWMTGGRGDERDEISSKSSFLKIHGL